MMMRKVRRMMMMRVIRRFGGVLGSAWVDRSGAPQRRY